MQQKRRRGVINKAEVEIKHKMNYSLQEDTISLIKLTLISSSRDWELTSKFVGFPCDDIYMNIEISDI